MRGDWQGIFGGDGAGRKGEKGCYGGFNSLFVDISSCSLSSLA